MRIVLAKVLVTVHQVSDMLSVLDSLEAIVVELTLKWCDFCLGAEVYRQHHVYEDVKIVNNKGHAADVPWYDVSEIFPTQTDFLQHSKETLRKVDIVCFCIRIIRRDGVLRRDGMTLHLIIKKEVVIRCTLLVALLMVPSAGRGVVIAYIHGACCSVELVER